MAKLRAYLNGLGMPKEDRDALPFGTTRTDLLSYAKGYEDAKREAREAAKTTKGVPEIGKTYNCFDDGKITNSRLYTVDVKEVVAFDEIDKETKDNWLEQVEQCHWLFSKKTDYFIKTGNGEKGDAVFVRTKCGGWFSLGNFMNSGRLDIDGKLTETLGFPTGKEIKQEAKEVAEDGGWISVDDRLPDVDQDVLLLTGSGIIEGSRTNGDYGDWNFITLNFHGCGCCRGDSDEVSHWQPLPSEPKTNGPSADLPTASK
jgi:hypothetical protein